MSVQIPPPASPASDFAAAQSKPIDEVDQLAKEAEYANQVINQQRDDLDQAIRLHEAECASLANRLDIAQRRLDAARAAREALDGAAAERAVEDLARPTIARD